jgi:hypothetical protein
LDDEQANLYGFSSLLETLWQYWTAEEGCFATPGSAFMTAQLRVDGIILPAIVGGDEERLDADEKPAIEESHVEDSVVEESLDEVERFRWQL